MVGPRAVERLVRSRINPELIATGGSDLTGFDKHGYSTAIQTQIIEGVFGFCGLKNVKLDILYQADAATPEQVEDFLQGLESLK